MFRRFPTKAELVDAVFVDRMDAYAGAVSAALEDPDPWDGFVGYIETVCAMQAADYGFADVLTTTFPAAKTLSPGPVAERAPFSRSPARQRRPPPRRAARPGPPTRTRRG